MNICMHVFIYLLSTDFYVNKNANETKRNIHETSLMPMSGHMPWLREYNLFIDLCYSI